MRERAPANLLFTLQHVLSLARLVHGRAERYAERDAACRGPGRLSVYVSAGGRALCSVRAARRGSRSRASHPFISSLLSQETRLVRRPILCRRARVCAPSNSAGHAAHMAALTNKQVTRNRALARGHRGAASTMRAPLDGWVGMLPLLLLLGLLCAMRNRLAFIRLCL